MSKSDHLKTYAEGWAAGDADRIFSAVADDYVMDDPNYGRVPKAEIPAYVDDLWAAANDMRGGKKAALLLELSEILIEEKDGELTASHWWKTPGTPQQGAGIVKVSERGVVSERLTYYTKYTAAPE